MKTKSGYFISDNLSLFYYKYIFRNMSRMNIMDPMFFMINTLQRILKRSMFQKVLSGFANSIWFEKTGKV